MRVDFNIYLAATAAMLLIEGCDVRNSKSADIQTQMSASDSVRVDERQIDDFIWDTYSTPDLKLLQVKGFVKSVEMKLGCDGLRSDGFTLCVQVDKGGTIAGAKVLVGEGDRMKGEVLHDASGRVSEMSFAAGGERSLSFSFDYQDDRLHRVEVVNTGADYLRESSYLMVYGGEGDVPSGARFSVSGSGGEDYGDEYAGVGQLAFRYSPDAAMGWNMCLIEGEANMTENQANMSDSIPGATIQTDTVVKIAISRTIEYYSRDEIDFKMIKMMNGW